MKELDSTEQEGLIISAYWPQRSRDEMPVGYGVSKRFIVYTIMAFILTLSNTIVKLPIGSKYISINPWLRPGLLLFTALIVFLPGKHPKKMMGFYQLDEHGMPTHYIGSFPPMSIIGHVGLSRKSFLQFLG